MDREFTYNLIRRIGTISINRRDGRRWRKEINIVSWNGREPRIDIREWSEDHEIMSKGITMTSTEMRKLYKILDDFYKAEENEATA